MTQNDNNRVAIVTGAAQGIGAAIARRLSKDGFDVVIADLPGRIADIKQMAETLSKGAARAVAAGCDVKSKADVEALVKTAVDSFGHLDVMVANAGIAPVGPFLSIDEKTMQDLVDVNIKGVLWCYQAAANQMIAQGTGGRLIAASSIAGVEGYEAFGAYSMTKFAVRALNQSAAKELGKHKINCNVYCPGPVDTPMWTKIDEAISGALGAPQGSFTKQRVDNSVLGRLVTVEDVANGVAFLAGPDSSFITGESLMISGGDAIH
ncbi:uncharacterized protein EHS24_006707 [Apiotrichum porosum]|uniref:Diacetyl reductase [(S)-acetoin forming] n=1 Tax=Apiotrichum porosum TaxID=105984 RepID=A0A427Y1U2_9TREE|nr:uncharacterized protein EHS24_006707 [Apiotrichum porosum]RSH85114.1 hypothetical protein EHS24_006707 [Apiotrichum porosum]